MTASFREGEEVAKPKSHGLGVLLMGWRNPHGKTATLAIDETYLARMQPAQRKQVEAVIRHVGVTAEIRAEEEDRRRAAAELSNFHYLNQLFVAPDGRFAFVRLTTIHTGILGKAMSVEEKRADGRHVKKLLDEGFRRTYRKQRLAEVMALLKLPIPLFLLGP
jgi:hypothetical protein